MWKMNNIPLGFIVIITAAACILLGSQWALAGQGTAPLYPGPVVSGGENTATIGGEGGEETRTYKIYYTRVPLNEVAAWYEGKMPEKSSDNTNRIVFNGPRRSSLEYDAVVVWRNESGITEYDILDPLEEEIALGAAGVVKTNYSRKDLEAVKAKYGYLADETFSPHFSAEERLAACQEKMESGVASAQQDQMSLQVKLGDLARQGRFEEMQQYLSQAQNVTSNTTQAMSVSHWDDWVGCLSELEPEVFRAEILIRIK
ncbi:MAG TPA: hypothetical protein ENH32_01130 [Proteobacteria bacterium]|nr:hypothetical protein BMS3Abin14_00176 [bacterium BMS3Abin14]HDL52556.1 hypothetical protein [Pseudomonadota bacterium]